MNIQAIKLKLKEKHLLYNDLSIMTGVPLSTIKRIMSGQTPNPRIDTIQKIERALEIDTTPKFAENYYTASEEALIKTYRALTARDKKVVESLATSLLNL